MNGIDYLALLRLAAPEAVVVAFGFAVLAIDLLVLRELELRWRMLIGALVAALGAAAGIAVMTVFPQTGYAIGGVMAVDELTTVVKVAILGLTLFSILLSVDQTFTDHAGEYFALMLFSGAGMMFLAGTEHLLMLFVALELTSLSLYILTAFNKQNARSAEAALKYFLFGGVSAAMTLFGLSLLYGYSGAVNIYEVAAAVHQKGADPLLTLGLVMTVMGFGFKVAAVPFHLWAPDAYEGAPVPSAALIASGSKVASFFILAKLLIYGLAGAEGSAAWLAGKSGWALLLAILAAASMLLGNLLAIVQSSVKRLIAYSAVAHAGYALVGIVAGNETGLAALLYYVFTYGLTVVGAFAVVALVEKEEGNDQLSSFAGLSRRQPIASLCMMVFVLSLAGIPPLAGFLGKFYVFAAALKSGLGLLWLVILALAMSAVSLYYYLQILKQVYIADPAAKPPPRVASSMIQQLVLLVLAALVLILGCIPNPVIAWISHAIATISP